MTMTNSVHLNKIYWFGIFIFILIFLLNIFNKSLFQENVSSNEELNIHYLSINDQNNKFSNYPIKINSLENSKIMNQMKLSFSVQIFDGSYNYGNIFQTSSDDRAIRIELQPNNSMYLFVGSEQFIIDQSLIPNKVYSFDIDFHDTDFILKINDKNYLFNLDGHNQIQNLSFNNFFIGTGYSELRNFNGEIFNVQVSSNYLKDKTFVLFLKCFYYLFALLTLYFLVSIKYKTLNQSSKYQFFLKDNKKYLLSQTFIFITFSLLVFLCVYLFSSQFFNSLKWVFYLFFPFLITLFLKQKFVTDSRIMIFVNVALSIFIFFMFYFNSYIFLFYLLLLFLIIYLPFLLRFYTTSSFNIFLISVLLLSFFSLSSIPNFLYLIDLLNKNFFEVIFFSTFFSILFSYFFSVNIITNSYQSIFYKNIFFLLFLTVIILLSFRIDALFISGSEYHWEYYLGPIRSLIDHHSLLWDIPSQYGLLNILFASFIDSINVWQSFYIFQSLLLAITAVIFLLIMYQFHITYFIFATIIFLLSFFFADPGLIGPQPFPSSSVLRFLFIYLFLYYLYYIKNFDNIFKVFLLSVLFIISIFWSAESFFYSSAIYFFVSTTFVVYSFIYKTNRHINKYFYFFPLVKIIIIALYFNFSNFNYDYYNFFEYAIGYSSGHGFVPVKFFGPIIFLIIIFSSYIYLLLSKNFILNTKYLSFYAASAAVIWCISSYYLGRPVGNNITAILPIFISISLLTISSFYNQNKSLILFVVLLSLPLIYVVFMTLSDQKFYNKLTDIKFYSSDVFMNRTFKESHLENILSKLNLENKYIVYYGNDAAFPRLSKFNSEFIPWLPTPLQLLEEPLNDSRRDEYLKRYHCNSNTNTGFLVMNNKDGIDKRFEIINKSLLKFYNYDILYEDQSYKILKYTKKGVIDCHFQF